MVVVPVRLVGCPVPHHKGSRTEKRGFLPDPEYADLGMIFCKSAAAALHLARHGVKATIERIVSADISAERCSYHAPRISPPIFW